MRFFNTPPAREQKPAEAETVERYLGEITSRLRRSDTDDLFFHRRGAREQLVAYSKAVTEYLHEKGISNMVIMDRSSRPLYIGVREYWRDKYPEEKIPGIYFMNPKGFKDRTKLTEHELELIAEECEWKGDASEDPDQARTRESIVRELEDTYTALVADKEKPLLVFDSCIHTGDTLSPVLETLHDAGFSNVVVGSINQSDRHSKVKADFYITNSTPANGCYPFDEDRMIEKTFDHVYSKRNST
jgi:rhodanese-related sulfurtransferase